MKNDEFDVLIEIPKGSRNKYEVDKASGRIRLDRMIFSSMQYPADYGYVENTLGLDGDPLDVLVFISEPTFPGCIIHVRLLGVFLMADDKGQDEKLLCVPISDPFWGRYNNMDELNPHLLKELEHFFRVYKDLENKKVEIQGFASKEVAIQILEDARKRYH